MFSHMFSKGCLLLGRWAHTRLFMSLVFLLSVMAKAILNVTVACCFYSTCLAGKRWCGFLWRKTRMRMRGDVPLKAHKRTAVKKGETGERGECCCLHLCPSTFSFDCASEFEGWKRDLISCIFCKLGGDVVNISDVFSASRTRWVEEVERWVDKGDSSRLRTIPPVLQSPLC